MTEAATSKRAAIVGVVDQYNCEDSMMQRACAVFLMLVIQFGCFSTDALATSSLEVREFAGSGFSLQPFTANLSLNGPGVDYRDGQFEISYRDDTLFFKALQDYSWRGGLGFGLRFTAPAGMLFDLESSTESPISGEEGQPAFLSRWAGFPSCDDFFFGCTPDDTVVILTMIRFPSVAGQSMSIQLTPIPEPETSVLVCIGMLLCFGFLGRRGASSSQSARRLQLS